MNCPACERKITSAARQCPACGFDFGEHLSAEIGFYLGLIKDFNSLIDIRKDLDSRLRALHAKLSGHERKIQAELSRKPNENMASETPLSEMPVAAAKPEGEKPVLPPPAPADALEPSAFSKPAKEPSLSGKQSRDRALAKNINGALELKLGQFWLLVAGIITMVFGVGYFLKYAFDQGWVGPATRVAMAYGWGGALLAGGYLFDKKGYQTYGRYLMGGGVAVLYFAAYAGFRIYALLPQSISFIIMCAITASAVFIALRYDTLWMAVLGLAGGFLTPVLLYTGGLNQTADMTYVAILNIGLLLTGFYRKWDLLSWLGFTFTWILYSSWFGAFYTDKRFVITMVFTNIYFLIYLIMPFAHQFLRKSFTAKSGGMAILVPNGFLGFGYSYYMISELYRTEWAGALALIYAMISASLALLMWLSGGRKSSGFDVLVSSAALFVLLSAGLMFSNNWITIFWALNGLMLLWLSLRLQKASLRCWAFIFLQAAVLKFLFLDLGARFLLDFPALGFKEGYAHLLGSRLVTELTVVLALYFSARVSAASDGANDSPFRFLETEQAENILRAMFQGLLLFILSAEFTGFFRDFLPAGGSAVLTPLWAAYALWIFGFSSKRENAFEVLFSLVLFSTAICRFVYTDYFHVYGFRFQNYGFIDGFLASAVYRWTFGALVLGLLYMLTNWIKQHKEAYKLNILPSGLSYAFRWAWICALFAFLNYETAGLFSDYAPEARFASVSVLWSAFGVGLMLLGFRYSHRHLRLSALGLFAVTLLKVFFVDMANVSTPYRIVSFIILGLLLMGASWLYYKYKERIIEALGSGLI